MKHLGHALRVYLKPEVQEWSSLLPSLEFSYSVLDQTGIGLTSYEILYGRKPRLPIDAELLARAAADNTPGFVHTFHPRFDIIRRIVREESK